MAAKRPIARSLLAMAVLVGATALHASAVTGQVVVGAGLGWGEGTGHYHLSQIHARVGLPGPAFAIGEVEGIGGAWACAGGSLEALRCGYDGFSLSLGAGAALISSDRFHLAPHVAIGRFQRYGRGEYGGDVSMTGSAGVSAQLRLFGVFHLQGGIRHRQIFDDRYRRNFDEYPHFTAATLGLGLGGRL